MELLCYLLLRQTRVASYKWERDRSTEDEEWKLLRDAQKARMDEDGEGEGDGNAKWLVATSAL